MFIRDDMFADQMQKDTYGDVYEIHVNPGYWKKRLSRQELVDIECP